MFNFFEKIEKIFHNLNLEFLSKYTVKMQTNDHEFSRDKILNNFRVAMNEKNYDAVHKIFNNLIKDTISDINSEYHTILDYEKLAHPEPDKLISNPHDEILNSFKDAIKEKNYDAAHEIINHVIKETINDIKQLPKKN